MATATTTTSHNQVGASFTNFPVLKIDPRDVFGSWKSFLKKFSLALKYQVIAAGKTTVTAEDGTATTTDNFTEDMKVLALLNSAGDEGLRILESQGIEYDKPDLTYDQALEALKNHYGREESLNIRVHKFVHAHQISSEDSRDYLRRVEHLSRSISVFKCEHHPDLNITDPAQVTAANTLGDRVREILALTAVVNGIRDAKLRKELMAKENLKWATLCKIVTARGSADDSSAKLDRPPSQRESLIPAENIKQEVAYSRYRSNSRNSRYRSSSRNRERSYSRGRYDSRNRNSRYDNYHSRRSSNDRNSSFNSQHSRYPSSRRDSSPYYDNRGRNSSYQDRHSSPYSKRHSSPYSKRNSSRDRDTRCFYCGDPSHLLRQCKKVSCILCNRKGHTAIDCDSKKSKEIRGIQDTSSPKSLRSRSPSPYPDRGRKNTPTQYVNRITLNPKTVGYTENA